MASILTRSLKLRVADEADLSKVLRQNHSTWSHGLSREQYCQLLIGQLRQPWFRTHCRYFVAEEGHSLVSSCKLYNLDFQLRGRPIKVGGVGGVFTDSHIRGKGYASQMLELVIEIAQGENFDALLLFSDIDPLFYERLGFELLPDNDFHIWTNTLEFARSLAAQTNQFADDRCGKIRQAALASATNDEIEDMVCHYRRYLSRQPYGLQRSEGYWRYKLRRQLFCASFVQDIPQLELVTLEMGASYGGYAVFEQGGSILRVLEVIGNEQASSRLWHHLFGICIDRKIDLLRGWEATAPEYHHRLRYSERVDFAQPMLLPFNDITDAWLDLDTCPLLEMDHF